MSFFMYSFDITVPKILSNTYLSFQEGWSLFDAQYYTFITLSTIGFGDFVALQNNKALQFEPGYVACSFIFLLLGLASLSSSINLLVLRFVIYLGTIHILRQQRTGFVSGSRKWPILLTFQYCIYDYIVGGWRLGVRNSPKLC